MGPNVYVKAWYVMGRAQAAEEQKHETTSFVPTSRLLAASESEEEDLMWLFLFVMHSSRPN